MGEKVFPRLRPSPLFLMCAQKQMLIHGGGGGGGPGYF